MSDLKKRKAASIHRRMERRMEEITNINSALLDAGTNPERVEIRLIFDDLQADDRADRLLLEGLNHG